MQELFFAGLFFLVVLGVLIAAKYRRIKIKTFIVEVDAEKGQEK